jgi:NAD(P)-dependent dehydrogenase (short-subunit alcohol dehydrogenase family)
MARPRPRLPANGGEMRAVSFDLEDIEGIPRFVAKLRKSFGPIYGLVNNAAVGSDGALSLMHNTKISQLVRLNTLSPIVFTKYAVRTMMADGGGRIINVASIVAFTGYSGLSVYAATKASMIGFTRSLAREVGRMGVNVNAVAPGFLDTDMTRDLPDETAPRLRGGAPSNASPRSTSQPRSPIRAAVRSPGRLSWPTSTVNTVPVMLAALSPSRNSTACATSPAAPPRSFL